MPDIIYFIPVESEDPCRYCGRKKLNENEKFYEVFLGTADTGIVVCELCKGGFSTRITEGIDKTHATHLAYYVRQTIFALKEKLPVEIAKELDLAIENYENGEFSSSFRNIGLVAEWLTQQLFVRKFGEDLVKKTTGWEDRLGRLLHQSRMKNNTPEEVVAFQLFS